MKHGKLPSLAWSERYTYVKNAPFGEKELDCKGAKFQIVKFPPGSKIAPHYHKQTTEIFYVRSGSGIIGMNGKKLRCKADDFVLCERGDVHEFENDGKEEFVILIFKTNEAEGGDMNWAKQA